MKSINVSLIAVSLCLCASSGLTQDDTREILVIANRVPQPANVVMAGTTIIDRDAIRKSLAQNLTELLSGLPGMQLAPAGGQGAQTSLFLRGTESDHTLILIDGVQISTSTGAAGRLEFIPLDQIERIEIVRGPRSSVYGSEAIGGVMNIITSVKSYPEFGGDVSLTVGTEHSSDVNMGLAGSNENTAFSFSASHRETDGISFKRGGDPDDDGYESDSFALSLDQKISDAVQFRASYSLFDTASDYDDGHIDAKSYQLAAGVNVSLRDNWESSLRIERFEEDNEDLGTFGTTASHSENRKLSWQNTVGLNDTAQLVFGADHFEQELRYATFGAVQSDTSRDNDGIYGVYLLDDEFADLTLSLRNDDNERFGNHSTGSIAIGRDFSRNFRAWVSYGTAFKAPNLIDLYVDFPSFFFFANPDLEPETSKNLELGLQFQALGAQWQLNGFRNDIDDLISIDSSFTTLANVQKARIDGVEASMAAVIAGWNADLSLTLLDHENRSTGTELARRPQQSVALNLARSFGAIDFALHVLAQSDHADIDPVTFGASRVSGYTVANLIAGYRINDVMNLRFRIANAFDRKYQIVDGFNTYGRTAQLSVDYRF